MQWCSGGEPSFVVVATKSGLSRGGEKGHDKGESHGQSKKLTARERVPTRLAICHDK